MELEEARKVNMQFLQEYKILGIKKEDIEKIHHEKLTRLLQDYAIEKQTIELEMMKKNKEIYISYEVFKDEYSKLNPENLDFSTKTTSYEIKVKNKEVSFKI